MALFGRNSTPRDLEDAVRRRIVGRIVAADDADGVESTTALGESIALEESPAQLLRDLAGALKRNGVDISKVTAANGGFLVGGTLDGATFRRWYSVQDVRDLAAVHAEGSSS